MIRATVWNEFFHEKKWEAAKEHYPDGMHRVIAAALGADPAISVTTATMDEPEQGLSRERLASTDVLLWWAHMRHHELADELADRVRSRVLEGMGLVALHSAHASKPFLRLLGTSGALRWREQGEREHLWVVDPGHEIARGVGPRITLEREEMYGEPFGIPEPDETVFLSWFEGGEVFRSGVCWKRGAGRIFYFRPGHETFPTYHHPQIQQVLVNATRWAAPKGPPLREQIAEAPVPVEPIGRSRRGSA